MEQVRVREGRWEGGRVEGRYWRNGIKDVKEAK